MARVLLLDEGWSSTVLLARGLECAGHAVTVLTPTGTGTSYRRRSVEWGSLPRLGSDRVMSALDDRVRATPFERVVPLSEAWMERLWRMRPAWHHCVYPATTEWQRELVASKQRLLAFMAGRGIAVPREVPLADALDLGFPLVIKGDTGAGGTCVRIVDDARELAAARLRATARGGAWFAQEYIAGPTYLVGALCHDGEALRVYAAEKLEQFPPRTGPAIRLRSRDHAALVALGVSVFRELRWTGLVSADVMQRPDGTFVLLEVNPRPWGSIGAARVAGVDLFGPFAELIAGRVPAADLRFRADADCMVFPRYLMAERYRGLGGVARALRDLFGEQGREWRHPAFALRNLRRLSSLRAQWQPF